MRTGETSIRNLSRSSEQADLHREHVRFQSLGNADDPIADLQSIAGVTPARRWVCQSQPDVLLTPGPPCLSPIHWSDENPSGAVRSHLKPPPIEPPRLHGSLNSEFTGEFRLAPQGGGWAPAVSAVSKPRACAALAAPWPIRTQGRHASTKVVAPPSPGEASGPATDGSLPFATGNSPGRRRLNRGRSAPLAMRAKVLSRSALAVPFPERFMASSGGKAAKLQASPDMMLLVVLVAGLAGVCLAFLFGSLPPTRRWSRGASPLLPSQGRWGLTHHERLQDPEYLRRILEAEQASIHPDGDDDNGPTASSPSPLQAYRPDAPADRDQPKPP